MPLAHYTRLPSLAALIASSSFTWLSHPTLGAETTSPLPACAATGFEDFAMPDKPFEYEVLRKDKNIGTHTLEFERTDEGLSVTAHTKMKVKLLFVTVYKYEYVSTEVWCDGKVQRIDSRVNDNGKKWETHVFRDGNSLISNSDEGTITVPEHAMPTNHWNAAVTKADMLYNTLTGKLDEIEVRPLETGPVPTKDGSKTAARYAMRGDLNIDTFYDANGNWSGMQFEHKDGSQIDFVCVYCGP